MKRIKKERTNGTKGSNERRNIDQIKEVQRAYFFNVSGTLKKNIKIEIARMIQVIKFGSKNGNLAKIESKSERKQSSFNDLVIIHLIK